MPTEIVYQYKILPVRTQKNSFEKQLRGEQYLLNRFTGERFSYIEWQEQFYDPCLPTGVWQSEFWQDSKVIRDLEANTRQLEKLMEQRLDLLPSDQKQQKELDKKIKSRLKTIDGLKEKFRKIESKDYLSEHKKAFGEELKCDIRITEMGVDVEKRDPNYGGYPRHIEKHVDKASQQAKLATSHPESLTAQPIVTKTGEVIDLSQMDSSVRQSCSARVDQTFKRWRTPDKNGNYSGKPRFKKKHEVTSFSVPNIVNKKLGTSTISLENIQVDSNGKTIKQKYRNKYAELRVPGKIAEGNIRVIYHRPIPEGSKICKADFIKKTDGWYVSLGLELASEEKQASVEAEHPTLENTVGFDAVLHEDVFLAGSNATKYKSHKHYRKAQKELARLQRREDTLSQLASELRAAGSEAEVYLLFVLKRLGKIRYRIKCLHQKIARQRKHFHYQVAHNIAEQPDILFVVLEKLKIKNLTKRNKKKKNTDGSYARNGQSSKSGLAKSWLDAGFYQFSLILEQVLKKYGKELAKVDPAYTSMVLAYSDQMPFASEDDSGKKQSDCGKREFWDEVLQILIDRDCNSGANLVRKFLEIFPSIKKNGSFGKSCTEATAEHFQELARKKVALVAK